MKTPPALLALLLLGWLGLRAPLAPAHAATDNGLGMVQATYYDVLALYYKPLDPDALLTAGWAELLHATERQNLAPPGPLPSLPADTDGAFSTFAAAYDAYTANLPAGLTAIRAAEYVSDGIVTSLQNDHSTFLPVSQFQNDQAQAAGTAVTGIGVGLTVRPPWIVTEVAPMGPADLAGVKPGDIITGVNGGDVSQVARSQLSAALSGAAGTVLQLTLNRAGQTVGVSLTIGPYQFPEVTSSLVHGVGYLRLRAFADSGVFPVFDRALDSFDAQGATGLVLDLRSNPGGSTTTAAEVLGRFLPDDATTVVRFDERGHRVTGIVSGQMHRVQLPLVVLVNGGSASSSEVTASTLRESGRALLAGQRTAGALATSQTFALPDGAGLQIALAEQVTSRSGVRIDGSGVPVDVSAADTRTADDYRNDRDPQLDAAIAALAQAPSPPAASASPVGLDLTSLRSLLGNYAPNAAQLPTSDRLPAVARVGMSSTNQVNQAIGIAAADPIALQATLRARGWLGEYDALYGVRGQSDPLISISMTLYQSAAGAADAVETNDFSQTELPAMVPIQIGDEEAAYQGVWFLHDSYTLTWRRDNIVFSVRYEDLPGYGAGPDLLPAVAQLVEAAYDAAPAALPAN